MCDCVWDLFIIIAVGDSFLGNKNRRIYIIRISIIQYKILKYSVVTSNVGFQCYFNKNRMYYILEIF